VTETLTRSPLAGLRSGALRLTSLLTTPLVPTDYLELLDPLNGAGSLRARVEEVRPETRDAVTLFLRPSRSWLGHTPGQYARIGVDIDGVRHWRAYSLTSPPRRDRRIAITVKAIPDGVVSTYLVRRARTGVVLEIDQAAGDFVLPEPLPDKPLFVTAGSGITPVMGILRHQLDCMADVVIVHSAPGPDDVIFGAELRDLAQRRNVHLVERHTDTDGMLTADDIDALVPDLADREVWACGPAGLLDTIKAHLAARGCADRLHTERFRASVVVAGDGGRVAFARTGVTTDADAATPLLEVGEAAGVLMPSGCRMGICFGCVLPLRAGAVRDLRSGALTAADGDEPVLVQTCISAAAGDCTVDV
jgi:stearoyl-CoA 9-desaturase NADPH oxidoreductase